MRFVTDPMDPVKFTEGVRSWFWVSVWRPFMQGMVDTLIFCKSRREAKLAFIRYRRKHPECIVIMERRIMVPLDPPVISGDLTITEDASVYHTKAKGGGKKHWLGYPKPEFRVLVGRGRPYGNHLHYIQEAGRTSRCPLCKD